MTRNTGQSHEGVEIFYGQRAVAVFFYFRCEMPRDLLFRNGIKTCRLPAPAISLSRLSAGYRTDCASLHGLPLFFEKTSRSNAPGYPFSCLRLLSSSRFFGFCRVSGCCPYPDRRSEFYRFRFAAEAVESRRSVFKEQHLRVSVARFVHAFQHRVRVQHMPLCFQPWVFFRFGGYSYPSVVAEHAAYFHFWILFHLLRYRFYFSCLNVYFIVEQVHCAERTHSRLVAFGRSQVKRSAFFKEFIDFFHDFYFSSCVNALIPLYKKARHLARLPGDNGKI